MKSILWLFLSLLTCQSVLAENTRNAVWVGFDGEYGLKNSTSPQSIELGLQAAIHEINANGGVLQGRPVKLMTKDNRSVPARGVVNLLEFAKQTELVAVFGGRFSPVLLQQLSVAHQHNMLLLDVWAAANGIIDHGYQPSFTFRLSLKDDWAMPAMLKEAQSEGHQSVGLILPNTGWGRSNKSALERVAKDFPDIRVAGIQWYNWGSQSILDQYLELVEKDAEVIILVANDNEAGTLLNQIIENPQIKKLPFISHWGVTGGSMFDNSEHALKKLDFKVIQTFSFFKAKQKPLERFMQSLAAVSNIDNIEAIRSPVGAAHAYDMMHILAKAIDKAGSTDRQAIRTALESNILYDGLIRKYDPAFSPMQHEALTPEQILMVRYRDDGVLVPAE